MHKNKTSITYKLIALYPLTLILTAAGLLVIGGGWSSVNEPRILTFTVATFVFATFIYPFVVLIPGILIDIFKNNTFNTVEFHSYTRITRYAAKITNAMLAIVWGFAFITSLIMLAVDTAQMGSGIGLLKLPAAIAIGSNLWFSISSMALLSSNRPVYRWVVVINLIYPIYLTLSICLFILAAAAAATYTSPSTLSDPGVALSFLFIGAFTLIPYTICTLILNICRLSGRVQWWK